jgi:hypothetical protein
LNFKIRTFLIDQSRVDIKLPLKFILVTIETNLIVAKTKGRLYQITLNFGSIELQFITEPGLFNRRVVHLLFTVRSLERPFSSKLVMLVESDPGYSRKTV